MVFETVYICQIVHSPCNAFTNMFFGINYIIDHLFDKATIVSSDSGELVQKKNDSNQPEGVRLAFKP